MAIKVTFLTVVTRNETVERRYPGGMVAYVKDNLIEKPYQDRNITGVIFMSTGEAEEFIEKLVKIGFTYDEIALVDQSIGPFYLCPWLGTRIVPFYFSKPGGTESKCWLKKKPWNTSRINRRTK
ncbi:MAG: hypothetical protein GX642_12595 [Smithella sp.]|jgi:hypothetical protein|nr:hypothetical protein [Smithella sp.]